MANAKKVVRVSDEEFELLKKLREKQTTVAEASEPQPTVSANTGIKVLADALAEAIERTKPAARITVANRKSRTPWTPPEGEAVVKLRRKFYHHGLQIDEKLSNQEKELLNQLKPGRFCDGHVVVTLRRDRGLDIDYPARTSSQRLLLVNRFGLRSFVELLERLIDEKKYPAKYRKAEDKDLYDLED
jgi:hypothetical protein